MYIRGTCVCMVYYQYVYRTMVHFTSSTLMSYFRSHATMSPVLPIHAMSGMDKIQIPPAEPTRYGGLKAGCTLLPLVLKINPTLMSATRATSRRYVKGQMLVMPLLSKT